MLDSICGNAIAGLAALDHRGQIDAHAENIPDGRDLRPGILECQQGGLGEEGVFPGVVVIGGVFRRGLRDEQDEDVLRVDVYIRDDITGAVRVEAGEVGALDEVIGFHSLLPYETDFHCSEKYVRAFARMPYCSTFSPSKGSSRQISEAHRALLTSG